MIYSVSHGAQKPPKHIILPAAIKALTGSKEVIQFINRLGHGLSYHQLEENETGLCMKKISSISEGSIPLPQYIQPYSSTTLAFDDIDMLEETLTGKGTIYRVN